MHEPKDIRLKKLAASIKPDENFVITSKQAIERQIRLGKPTKQDKVSNYRILITALSLVAVVSTFLTTTAVVNNARPGDFLYPIDRALEQAQLFVTQKDAKPAYLQTLVEERITEYESLEHTQIASVQTKKQLTSALENNLSQPLSDNLEGGVLEESSQPTASSQIAISPVVQSFLDSLTKGEKQELVKILMKDLLNSGTKTASDSAVISHSPQATASAQPGKQRTATASAVQKPTSVPVQK